MHLGDCFFPRQDFSLDSVFKNLQSRIFSSSVEKNHAVNTALLGLIQNADEPCFLLPAVLDFVRQVELRGVLQKYSFGQFELWLNQVSGLSFEENLRIRAKIVGKYVDRSAYSVFFPIGTGKVYDGTHFVTAHKSPDLDTTIASFWGWVDAFGAKVGNSLHVWNVPGGPPTSQMEIKMLFEDIFSPAVFTHLPKTRTTLNIVAKDLMSRQSMSLKGLHEPIIGADHERDRHAVVVVDDEGFYLGDWRSFDVEEVREVIILLSMCLRWFENHLQLKMISLFAEPDLQFKTKEKTFFSVYETKVKDCDPAVDFTHKQRSLVSKFIKSILKIEHGLEVSFDALAICLTAFVEVPFHGQKKLLQSVKELFDDKGVLIESRPKIFSFLQIVISDLHEAILKTRQRLERLDIAMETKHQVFLRTPTFLTASSEVEEIRQKMGSYFSLTVTVPDSEKLIPVGVIQAQDVRKNILGTVSLRDFCNRDEMGIPQYLDVISVIDHHKSQLQTMAPPFALIADVQSSNTLVARQAFIINDQYSTSGMTVDAIDRQIKELTCDVKGSPSILQKLLQKKRVAKTNNSYFIDTNREFTEYLHFLYGIIDDTDLLSKVSAQDVECVVSLLNRMKTIVEGREVEVLCLDDLPRDKNFAKKAAQRILQNEEMYSLYSKVYAHREKEAEQAINLASNGKPSHFFSDTKVQNICCKIGQTKIFACNISQFQSKAHNIASHWVKEAEKLSSEKSEIDLYLHMVSTIVSADDVYKGNAGNYVHKDEMWIWIPETEMAVEHLKRFLTSFQESPGLKNNPMELEFVGKRAKEYALIFKECFLSVPSKVVDGEPSIVILRFKAGSLNSRKAMISPFLPTL